ncbi:MAG: hypothetical protein SFY69_02125 [Planctomycetota bacterium]|nr:hypothetical protein [Planctomycetota bacterium]
MLPPAPAPTTPGPRDPAGDPWAQVLSAAAPNRRLRVLLNDCTVARVEDDLVVLSVSDALLGAAQANEKDLCALLAKAWDRAVRLELRSSNPPAPSGAAAETPAAPGGAPGPDAPAKAAELPLVRHAMELFQARLVSVQARKPKGE